MAHAWADRVKETTTTTGTGTLTLAGAVTGYQSFAAIGDGNTCYYVIEGTGTGEWETGIGTYTASGTTLARTTVLGSSNSGSAVNLSAGTKLVYVSTIAGRIVGQQTIWIPAGAMEPRVTTAPATSNTVEIGTSLLALRTMDFATDADDHAGFAIQMPKSWDAGTVVAQFVWSHAATTTDFGVAWFIRAGAYADNDVLTTALGTAVGVTDTGGTTDDVYVTSETAAITVAGTPGPEEWVYFEVYRDVSDAADTMAIDARLHGVKIHYTTTTLTDD